jgi:hypothetical protein
MLCLFFSLCFLFKNAVLTFLLLLSLPVSSSVRITPESPKKNMSTSSETVSVAAVGPVEVAEPKEGATLAPDAQHEQPDGNSVAPAADGQPKGAEASEQEIAPISQDATPSAQEPLPQDGLAAQGTIDDSVEKSTPADDVASNGNDDKGDEGAKGQKRKEPCPLTAPDAPTDEDAASTKDKEEKDSDVSKKQKIDKQEASPAPSQPVAAE